MDNSKYGEKLIGYEDISIDRPDHFHMYNFDKVIIATVHKKLEEELREQLAALGVQNDMILSYQQDREKYFEVFSTTNEYDEDSEPRVLWLKDYAELVVSKALFECAI